MSKNLFTLGENMTHRFLFFHVLCNLSHWIHFLHNSLQVRTFQYMQNSVRICWLIDRLIDWLASHEVLYRLYCPFSKGSRTIPHSQLTAGQQNTCIDPFIQLLLIISDHISVEMIVNSCMSGLSFLYFVISITGHGSIGITLTFAFAWIVPWRVVPLCSQTLFQSEQFGIEKYEISRRNGNVFENRHCNKGFDAKSLRPSMLQRPPMRYL